jgi:trehalose 6-phosphate phosphatase
MPDFLFDHIYRIYKKFQKSEHIFLFLDYDGTLVPFKDTPTQVTTPKQIKKVIRQLIKNPKVKVIIATGRQLQDIKELMNVKGVSFIALHGLEIETADGMKFCWKQATQARLLIKTIKKDMQKKLTDEKGAFLEDKELTIVFHYRLLAKNKIHPLRETFKKIVRNHDTQKILEIINGAKIIEARPKGWNKGKGIEIFLAQYTPVKNILPIYIGDDITDEDAFRFLGKRGITIHVTNRSKRKTSARYQVKNPDEVYSFLQSLSQIQLLNKN